MIFAKQAAGKTGVMWIAWCLLALGTAGWANASEVRFFELGSQKEFLRGTLDGIAIDRLGNLSLADRAERVADLGEPFLLDAAKHPSGWVVGTGNDGKVLHVGEDGSVKELFAAPEPEVFAVWADPDGTVLAASSPSGKVYEVSENSSKVVFDPGETYVWDLARDRDGSLLVATGIEGKLFRVKKSGESEVLFDSDDTHIRTIKLLANGDLLIGTAGEGLILRREAGGSVRTLFDASHPEVVAFAEGAGGTSYAAVLASEASLIDLAPKPAQPNSARSQKTTEDENQGQVKVTIEGEPAQQQAVAGSRPGRFQGPRSEILRIGPDGSVDTLWAFDAATVYSLSWQGDRLWVGTGLEGKVFSLRNGEMVLEKDLDERQVVAVLTDGSGPVYATTNSAAIFSSAGEPERVGTFTSPVLDAAQTSEFGSLRWTGSLPKGTDVKVSARSGMSGHADRTWSAWTDEASGTEVGLEDLPHGRFIQWRARLESANGTSPELSRVTVSYRQKNLPPRVTKLEVLAPGQIIAPAGFNAGSQVFEPSRPDKNGMFSPLGPPRNARERQGKRLWKMGYRTLTWDAKDPNGDRLRYALFFRREGPGNSWLPIEDEIEAKHFSFDAAALPDGVYRFKLEVFDRSEGEGEPALVAERISDPAYVDHTVPGLGAVKPESSAIRVEVRDAMSPLVDVRFSLDAGEWRPASVADGLLDGQEESVLLELGGESGELLLLRVRDAAHNAITFDLSDHLP